MGFYMIACARFSSQVECHHYFKLTMSMISRSRHVLLILFLNILSLGGFAASVLAQPSLIELIEQKKDAIVTIQAQTVEPNKTLPLSGVMNIPVLEKTGAGIIIDPRGYIVTNTHTILYAQFIFVTLNDGTRFEAAITSIAPGTDFTILKINSTSPLKFLDWADPRNITLGTEVISIGNSTLWKQTICGGKITGIANKLSQDTVALMEMDIELDRGDSGGPVLDRKGNFLGIIIAKNTRASRASYAIPSTEIRKHFMDHLTESRP